MPARGRPRRRGGLGWLLVAAFVLVPILEIYVLIQVGRVIGAWWTILLLTADSVFGGWLIRREGGRAWRALQQTIGSGHLPTSELADGALIIVGGALMLSPGFVTDVFGFFCILPFTRPIARRALNAWLARRVTTRVAAYAPRNAARPGGAEPGGGTVIRGEVVDESDE